MKAGLVTFYHIHHYGALLQAAATERAVERFGWDCEIIDYFVNQDNALFKRPTGLGSAAHDAHTALHFGHEPIHSTYYVTMADFVACHKTSYIKDFDIVSEIKPRPTTALAFRLQWCN